MSHQRYKNPEEEASQNGRIVEHPASGVKYDLNDLGNAFLTKPAGEWLEYAATKPVPDRLFGDLWVEGELCVLFAPTNAGKSILAVQIADCITKGLSWGPLACEAAIQNVLYIDFELSDRQFTRRYSQEQNGRYINLFKFSRRFLRAEPITPEEEPENWSDFYIDWITFEVERHDAKVVIIDNMTWLSTKLEKANDAGPFMTKLNRLKRKHELSLLLIAHTPKRDQSKPMVIDDLQGSSRLGQFLDSCFAINYSRKDPDLRYIIQLKVRDSEKLYHHESVMTCMLEKNENWLGYRFLQYDSENIHLHDTSDEDKAKRGEEIRQLRDEGFSLRAIGEQLGISRMTVKRVLERLEEAEPNTSDEENDVPF